MQECDLYSNIINAGGKFGGQNNSGLILLGRVNNSVPAPFMLSSKHEAVIKSGTVKCCIMDVYAIQIRSTEGEELFACRGRVLVVLDSSHPEYTATAVRCKLYYNRPTVNLSRESNLIVACLYEYISENTFVLKPAEVVLTSSLKINPADKEQIISQLVDSPVLKQADVNIASHIAGYDCPLLNGSTEPAPSFYVANRGTLVFQSHLMKEYNVVSKTPLAPEHPQWGIAPSLDEALGYTRNASKRTCLKLRHLPPIVKEISTALHNAEGIIQTNLDSLDKLDLKFAEEKCTELRDNICTFLKQNWGTRVLDRLTGKMLVKKMCGHLIANASVETEITTADEAEDLLSKHSSDEILTAMSKNIGTDSKLVEFFIGTNSEYSMIPAFIWSVLNLRCSYKSLSMRLDFAKSIYYMANHTYFITFIAPNIPVLDLDKIACFMGNAFNAAKSLASRCSAYMHNYMTTLDSRSIMVKLSNTQIDTGYCVDRRLAEVYDTTGTFLNEAQISIAKTICGSDVNCSLMPVGTPIRRSRDVILPLGIDTETLITHYQNSGLGIVVGQYMLDYVHAYMFIYCMKRLYDLSLTSVTASELSDDIREKYETACEFKLEDEQAKVSELIHHNAACLTGPAGSGKTTCLKYYLECMKESRDIDLQERVLLLAPTGMAAQRMHECSGLPTHTIHSALHIFGDTFDWGNDKAISHDIKSSKDVSLVIFDESSMISLPLFYAALRRIDEDIPILLCGDIEQLPPIGFGKPFADALKFLPFVRLNVSKRASENSAITRNCNNWISEQPLSLSSSYDMAFIPAKDDSDLPNIITKICRYHIGDLKMPPVGCVVTTPDGEYKTFRPEDIQVVTPVTRKNYVWGSTILNGYLQELFNPRKRGVRRYTLGIGDDIREFRVGDRVINTANTYNIPRWVRSDTDANTFIASGENVMNGEIGYIRFITEGEQLTFLTKDGIVHNKASKNKDRYGYVGVEFTSDGLSEFVMYKFPTDTKLTTDTHVTRPEMLNNLELAYALTVHKMQGNQAKLVIAPMFGIQRSGFISRNMVYTAWSRASEGLYVIGDINQNFGSTLERARKIDSLGGRRSPLDNIL